MRSSLDQVGMSRRSGDMARCCTATPRCNYKSADLEDACYNRTAFSWSIESWRGEIHVALIDADARDRRPRQTNCVRVKGGAPLRQELARRHARSKIAEQGRRAIGPIEPRKLRISN
jgi:hypothetical protein